MNGMNPTKQKMERQEDSMEKTMDAAKALNSTLDMKEEVIGLKAFQLEFPEVAKWLEGIKPFAFPEGECFRISMGSNEKETSFHIKFFTDIHSYAIYGKIKASGGTYLGAGASCRKPLAGENWTRGNDLPDGDLNLETWNSIVRAIVKYEIVKIECPKIDQGDEEKKGD